MRLSLLENQPIHGLRSLFAATGIVLFVGLYLDWPHAPSWYLVTVAPFLVIFIGAMGLRQGWHYTVWSTLGRIGPAGRAGDALRGRLAYRLIRLRLHALLAPRVQPSGTATFDAALAEAAQALDSAAHALPATLRRSAVLTALDVIQAETQAADDVPRLTRRLTADMLATGVYSRLHLPPGGSSLRRLLGPHGVGLLLTLVAAGSAIVVVGVSAAGPGPALLVLLLVLLAMAGAALWIIGTLMSD